MLIDDTKVDCGTARSFPAVCGGFGVKVTVLVPDDEDDEDSWRDDGDMVIGPFGTREHAEKVVRAIRSSDTRADDESDDDDEEDEWEEESVTSAKLISQTRPFPKGLHEAMTVVGSV